MLSSQSIMRRVTRQQRRGPLDFAPGMDQGTAPVALAFFVGMLVGAVLMYVLDPEMGRRRRALARDQVVHAQTEAGNLVEDARGRAQHVRNRAQGTMTEMRG